VELDFGHKEKPGSRRKAKQLDTKTKPVSSVKISTLLVEDQESSGEMKCQERMTREGDDASTTSNLSEDFSVDKKEKNTQCTDEDSVTSFGSESFADELPFTDVLADSLRPSDHDLSVLGTLDETTEMEKMPNSYRSDNVTKPSSASTTPSTKPNSERTKPNSERSKGKKIPKKAKMSPRPAHSKPMKSKSMPGMRRDDATEDGLKELRKRISPKPTKSSTRQRRRLPSSGGGDETDESFREEKIKKPKRRLRTRSGDGDEIGIEKVEALQDEPKESSLTKEESNSSLGKEPKRKQERERTTPTRSKSKGKLRKPPSRSKSKKDEDGTKDVRKRYKKKSTLNNESDAEEETAEVKEKCERKSRSTQKDLKKKMRSKSNDSEGEKLNAKINRNSNEKRRRKKKTTSKEGSSPKSNGEESPTSDKPDSEAMEMMTYSFNCQSSGDDEEENDRDKSDIWVNCNNSTSSSLSYNSFAQFSIDVAGDLSGVPVESPGNGWRNSFGNVADLDASVQTFVTEASNLDASVVFMSAKKKGAPGSMTISHYFDSDRDEDRNTSRTSRSVPDRTASSEDGIKRAKQLRRRLKKDDNNSEIKRKDDNSEIKKKVSRAKSGGLDRLKSSVASGVDRGRRMVERTKSDNIHVCLGSSKLVTSSARRQERQEKSNRRKKVKDAIMSSGKSKSTHARGVSQSPRGEDTSWHSPVRSPKERKLKRTFSNPMPSPGVLSVGNSKEFSTSPVSCASAPAFDSNKLDNSVRSRRNRGDRRALLADDSDSDESSSYLSQTPYSPRDGKKRTFLPKRGIERTPSSLLAGARNYLKEKPVGRGLSSLKKTFSISGRGKDQFNMSDDSDNIEIGMTHQIKGYVSRNDRRRMVSDSTRNKNQIKNSLYGALSDDDSSVEISDDSNSERRPPKRIQSMHETLNGSDDFGSDDDKPKPPRRINSLPLDARKPSP